MKSLFQQNLAVFETDQDVARGTANCFLFVQKEAVVRQITVSCNSPDQRFFSLQTKIFHVFPHGSTVTGE